MTAPNDTKTALLPAARLAEIRETFAAHDNGEAEVDAQGLADFTRALLAHLDALAAPCDRETGGRLVREVWIAWAKEQPVPKASWLVEWEGLSEPDREVDRRIFEACYAAGRASLTPRAPADGEALGREARASHMDWSEDTASVWPFLTEKVRGDYCRTAIALHAIGYAAGRSEGDAERARATQEGTDIGRAQGWKEANVEIDRLVEARTERDATIARLTAELAEARAAIASAANGSIDDIEAARRFGYHERDAEVAAARLDGAREERERLAGELSIEFERLSRLEHDRGELCPVGDADGNAHDAARDAYNEAAKLVRARAAEGRQG